jgi:ankyrin repeat protein
MGKREVVDALVAMPGIEVDARGEYGQNVLFELSGDPLKTLAGLVRAGVDLNAQDVNGFTTLMRAVEKQDANYIKALVNQGIDLEIRNIHGMNAWELAHAIAGMPAAQPPESRAEYARLIVALAQVHSHFRGGTHLFPPSDGYEW